MWKSKGIPEFEGQAAYDANFGTIPQLLQFMLENDIPLHAHIEYRGCGSHSIDFVWDDEALSKTTLEDIFPEVELRNVDG